MGTRVNRTCNVASASKAKLSQTGLLFEEVVMAAMGTTCHTWDTVVRLTPANLPICHTWRQGDLGGDVAPRRIVMPDS